MLADLSTDSHAQPRHSQEPATQQQPHRIGRGRTAGRLQLQATRGLLIGAQSDGRANCEEQQQQRRQ